MNGMNEYACTLLSVYSLKPAVKVQLVLGRDRPVLVFCLDYIFSCQLHHSIIDQTLLQNSVLFPFLPFEL